MQVAIPSTKIVTKIEANPLLVSRENEYRQLRVAAYCRVSTDSDEQLDSYEAQLAYYTDAIAKNPKILLCDEPTGALDSKTGKMIIDLLYKTCKEMKMTTVLITHNVDIAKIADKIITIENGTVQDIKTKEELKTVEIIEEQPKKKKKRKKKKTNNN